MVQARHRVIRHATRSRPWRLRAVVLLLGILALALGGLVWSGPSRTAAVAAPGSHDGLSRVALERPPELPPDPALGAAPAPDAPRLGADGQTVAPPRPARPPLVAPRSDNDFGDFYVHVPPVIS